MKKNLLFLSLIFISFGVFGQNYSDDFESFAAGDFIALKNNKWSTWSAAPGTAEDTKVTDEKAKSGTKSLKFVSTTASGGPTDLILPFNTTAYDKGIFELDMQIYVEASSAAYFNFQAVAPVGKTWALDCYFTAAGDLNVTKGSVGGLAATAKYQQGTWNKIAFKLDLTLNIWEVLLNDVSVGKYDNPNNSVYAMDIFPLNQTAPNLATFYIDDVNYKYTAPIQKDVDVAVLSLNVNQKVLNGKAYPVGGVIRNIGLTTIDSLDFTWNDGTNNVTQKLKGLALAPFKSYTYTASQKYTADKLNNNIKFSVSNPNNLVDLDLSNNSKSKSLTVVVPAVNKHVLAEEITGTWCQWCPRGAVFMNYMTAEYPNYFIGIAAHGGSANEPMLLKEYVDGVLTFPGVTGYPGIVTDRTFEGDPSGLEEMFFTQIEKAPVSFPKNKVTYDATSGVMNINVTTKFTQNLTGDYKVVIAIVEDSVKGTTTAYNQSNAYAGGTNGVMGGYEKLTNPVPAAKMVYMHVARALIGTYAGDGNALPDNLVANIDYPFDATYTIPATWKAKNLKVVSMIVSPTGEIDNATELDFVDFTSGTSIISEHPAFGGIYPNPSNDLSNVELNLTENTEVAIKVTNISGQLVASKTYGILNGDIMLPINTAAFDAGLYLVQIQLGNSILTKKLVVNK